MRVSCIKLVLKVCTLVYNNALVTYTVLVCTIAGPSPDRKVTCSQLLHILLDPSCSSSSIGTCIPEAVNTVLIGDVSSMFFTASCWRDHIRRSELFVYIHV